MADYESPRPNADRQFVADAATGNNKQIDIGSLATQISETPAVKEYAFLLMQYHSSARDELKRVADTINLEIHVTPAAKDEAMKTRLSGLSGKAFDSTYLRAEIDENRKAIDVFEAELNAGESPTVLRYTRRHLPEIRAHLRIADSLMRVLP
jgi:putative membrane protein